jgi:hypothetical protein
MSYKISRYGNIIKVDLGIISLVPMNESSVEYQQYIQFLQSGGTIDYSDLYIEEEAIEASTPTEVALWKLRFVLSQMNLEQSVSEALNTLPEPQKTAANYIWNYGNSIDRHSSTIAFLQQSLGLSNIQVNQMFIQANSITL